MATVVKNISIAKVKQARYVSIIADSVLDIDHVDQLTFILKCVNKEESTAEQLSYFIHFISHSSQQTWKESIWVYKGD
jgi:hypothetical protein